MFSIIIAEILSMFYYFTQYPPIIKAVQLNYLKYVFSATGTTYCKHYIKIMYIEFITIVKIFKMILLIKI